jgi:hypothetical protein
MGRREEKGKIFSDCFSLGCLAQFKKALISIDFEVGVRGDSKSFILFRCK